MKLISMVFSVSLCSVLLSSCAFFSKPRYSASVLEYCQPPPVMSSPKPDYSKLTLNLENKTYDEIYELITGHYCNKRIKNGVVIVSGFGRAYELEQENISDSENFERAKERALLSAYINAENLISRTILFDNYTIERLFYPNNSVKSDIMSYIKSNKKYKVERISENRVRIDLYLDDFFENIAKIIVKYSEGANNKDM